MNYIIKSVRFLFSHIGKVGLGLLLIFVFLFLLFPFSDLNDLVSMQISKLTQNKVFLQFEDLHLNPFTASVEMGKVFVETSQLSNLSIEELSLSPSLTSAIQGKPGGTIKAFGFLKGDVQITLTPSSAASKSSSKNETKDSGTKAEKYTLEAKAQNINLKDLKEMAGLSLPIKGQLNFTTQAVADISFQEQPEGEISITINNFELPPSSLSLADLGRVNLPEIKLGLIELKGKLSNGKLLIETGKIGTTKDEFYGDIKGDMGLTLQNDGGQIVPMIGAYNISVELKATAAFKERAKFFLTFLDGYKKEVSDGTQYNLRIQASAMGMPPQITPLQ